MIKPSIKTKPDGRRWWIAVATETGKQITRWPLAYGRWSTRAACERAILMAEKMNDETTTSTGDTATYCPEAVKRGQERVK